MFNQSIKQLKDYELQSIDSLSNKSIAESEALLMKTPKYVTDPMIVIQMTSYFACRVFVILLFLRYFFVLDLYSDFIDFNVIMRL